MEFHKYGAIDIGSNAVRLLIANVIVEKNNVNFQKASLIRVPLRLGFEAFIDGKLSRERSTRLVKTLIAFKHLIDVQDIEAFKACATSAMREASNGPELIREIEKETGIHVEIIDGKKEAEIIFQTHAEKLLGNKSSYLYVDVGGGSTEVTLFSEGSSTISRSFKIGTIRMLKNQVTREDWKEFKQWIKKETKNFRPLSIIGSGGNVNKLFKFSGNSEGVPLRRRQVNELFKYIDSHTYEEKMNKLNMNPDRADVIIPGILIYKKVMKWTGAKKLYVPKIGLVDGIVHELYTERYPEHA